MNRAKSIFVSFQNASFLPFIPDIYQQHEEQKLHFSMLVVEVFETCTVKHNACCHNIIWWLGLAEANQQWVGAPGKINQWGPSKIVFFCKYIFVS